ncbi:imidazolonepropionase [Vibrio panuliri]|uniref:Imidazolonepropionase n=2 Tax=Vibrio panuliri TaxID=1381081 RepID=A0A1Q9HF09_9VIBR|nr:imidazolonepropionase [Vibrio panuliri]
MSTCMTTPFDLHIANARFVTMSHNASGYQILSGHLYLRDGKVAAISPNRLETPSNNVLDVNNKLITPGLIDCHTHLIYAGNRANEFEMRLNGVPYQTIAKQGGGILSTVRATREASQQQLTELALPRLDGLLASGVTSVEIKSGYGLTLKDEVKMLRAAKALESYRNVRISTTLLAAHAVPPEFSHCPEHYVDLICNEMIPYVAEHRLADSVDAFCESIAFNLEQTERVFHTARQYGLAVKGHTEQLSNLGGSALTAKYQGLSADHIEFLDLAGVKALADAGTVATLLPGAYYFLRETQLPPIELLREHQVPIALASDLNPGTSPFADLTMMMNMGCTLFGLTPEETLRGMTANAAKALGVGSSRGKIEVGFDADFAIWDIDHPAELSYLQGVQRLFARLIQGEVCYV